MDKQVSRRSVYVAECLGTFLLVFCGTGAIIINHRADGVITHPGVAATFGLVVMVLIFAFGGISGAHFNPAVTLAFWAAKLFPGRQVLPYLGLQFTGALAASISLRALFPEHPTLGATLPTIGAGQAFIMETLLTFFLMLVVFTVALGEPAFRPFAPLAIGATVGLEALFAGPVTGASMNPARSLGPALVSGHLESAWLYVLAPVCGALLALLVWRSGLRGNPDA